MKASQPIDEGSHWSGLVNLVLHWTMRCVSGSVMPCLVFNHCQSILANAQWNEQQGFQGVQQLLSPFQELSYHIWSRLVLWVAFMNLLSTQSQCKVATYSEAEHRLLPFSPRIQENMKPKHHHVKMWYSCYHVELFFKTDSCISHPSLQFLEPVSGYFVVVTF